MNDLFDQIKTELKEQTPIFDTVSNTLRPIVQSSEIVGGLKALVALSEKIEAHNKHSQKFTGADLLRYIDEVREETVRNRRG
jgi:hypothetical protein